ncbi:Major facilitator superfamily domain containing protein [Naviculisporaceae sp. PSN 640]
MRATSPARTDPGISERSPLIPPYTDRQTNSANGGTNQEHATIDENVTGRPVQAAVGDSRPIVTIGMCVLLIILLDIGVSLVATGLLQVQEDIICRDIQNGFGQPQQLFPHTEHEDRPNKPDCKGNDVQSELSIIQSWSVVFDLLPGVVMAVPLGLVADRYGRSLVLGLSLLGISLSYGFSAVVCAFPSIFPVRLVWLSSLFMFIGGSVTVFSAMLFSIAADVSSEEQRSTTFFYLGAVLLGGAVLSNPVTYWVMEAFGTWSAILAGLCLMALTTALGFSIPETLKQVEDSTDSGRIDSDDSIVGSVTNEAGTTTATTRANPSTATEDNYGNNSLSPPQPWKRLKPWLAHQVKSGSARFQEFLRIVYRDEPKAGLLLLCLLFTTFGKDAQIMLLQYVVAKFRWSWSEAGLIVSIQCLVSLIQLVIVLPALAQYLLRILASHPRTKDLWLARASIVILLIGSLIIGLASSPQTLISGVALQALGTGFNPLVRGMITNLLTGSPSTGGAVNQDGTGGDHGQRIIGLLNSVIAFLETAGTMVANPLLGVAFRAGLGWGGQWIGLPFLLAAGLFAGALTIVGLVDV